MMEAKELVVMNLCVCVCVRTRVRVCGCACACLAATADACQSEALMLLPLPMCRRTAGGDCAVHHLCASAILLPGGCSASKRWVPVSSHEHVHECMCVHSCARACTRVYVCSHAYLVVHVRVHGTRLPAFSCSL